MSILWTLYFLYMQYHAEAQTGPRHDVSYWPPHAGGVLGRRAASKRCTLVVS